MGKPNGRLVVAFLACMPKVKPGSRHKSVSICKLFYCGAAVIGRFSKCFGAGVDCRMRDRRYTNTVFWLGVPAVVLFRHTC